MLTGRVCLLALSPFAARQPPIRHRMCTEATPAPELDTEAAPSWEALQQLVLDTPTGARLTHEGEQRARGQGPPHTAATWFVDRRGKAGRAVARGSASIAGAIAARRRRVVLAMFVLSVFNNM